MGSYPFDGPQFLPKELPAVSGPKLLVFPPAAVELLSAHVIPTSTPQKFVIEPPVKRGMAFEWKRTVQLEPGVFVDDASRFYFRKNDSSPFNQEVSRMVRRLFSYVKRTSPLKSTGKIPRFIGASLAQRIQEGSATLLYPNRTTVELMPNPIYKSRALDA